MTPPNSQASPPGAPVPPGSTDASTRQTQISRATTNQRIGLAVLSLMGLVFLLNIVAALARDLGPAATTAGIVAVCLVVLGMNIAFNFDLLRRS